MPSDRTKSCPVPNCTGRRTSTQLLCARHWFMVPQAMRDRVWKLYRSAAGSPAHREACTNAIRAAVEADRERRKP